MHDSDVSEHPLRNPDDSVEDSGEVARRESWRAGARERSEIAQKLTLFAVTVDKSQLGSLNRAPLDHGIRVRRVGSFSFERFRRGRRSGVMPLSRIRALLSTEQVRSERAGAQRVAQGRFSLATIRHPEPLEET